jgi:hypothetical protein
MGSMKIPNSHPAVWITNHRRIPQLTSGIFDPELDPAMPRNMKEQAGLVTIHQRQRRGRPMADEIV